MKSIYRLVVAIAGVQLIVGCGTANVNKIFGSTDDSYAGLMQRAQLAYDRGEYDLAEEYASKAYAGTTQNGEAAVLLSSIVLGKAGADIFQIVGKMAEISSPSTTTTADSECASAGTSTAGSLSQLSCALLDLSQADVAALGQDVALISPGLSSLGTYYVPAKVDDALRAKINVLTQLDKGVRYLCPFINREVVLASSIDERHAAAVCPDRTSTHHHSAKAHISFALLHLIETLVYQSAIVVDSLSTDSTGKVGVSTIASTVSKSSFTNVSDFVLTMDEFKTVVDNVADTTSNTSQIAMALDGLLVVVASFTQAGVPEKVISGISGGLAKLKETAGKLSEAAGGAAGNYQAQALKGQINEAYAKTVSSKISSVCGSDGATCSAEQQTQVCASYAGISEGVDPAKVSKPSFCP